MAISLLFINAGNQYGKTSRRPTLQNERFGRELGHLCHIDLGNSLVPVVVLFAIRN
jgi:hypothetical protein